MRGITERDIAYDMLFGSKASAKLFCEASIESAHHNVYHLFRELEHHAHESQHRIWEYLHRRSEYRVEEAHPREVEESRHRMERLAQDHLAPVGAGEYGRYPNTTVGTGYTGSSTWSTGSAYGTPGTTFGSATTGYDWSRSESSRNLPEWVREPTRR